MTTGKWEKTNFTGVRFRKHATRKHGVNFDRYFVIRYQRDGKRIEESLGWTSERDPEDGQFWTEAKAALVLERLRGAAKHGKKEAPTRLGEKREIERQRKEDEKAAQELAEKENVTFDYYFEKVYFPTFEVGRKKETTRKAREHFKNWLEPVIGNIPLKDVKPFTLEKIKKNILDAGKSPRTLQYVLATFRQVWNMARRDGLVSGDTPTRAINKPKVDNRRVRFLSHKEADILLNALQEKDAVAYNMALLSLHTGLRMGEITGLKWSHIDTERGIIRVMDAKGGEGRAAFMTEKLKAMFEAMTRREPEDFVFTRKIGKDLKEMPLKEMPRIFFEAVAELKFNEGITDPRQKVVAHTLRHTYASWHVTAGTDIYTLKELLGHSVIAMTERYSHLAPATLQNATRGFEQAIASAGQDKTKEQTGQVVNFKK
ncbi:MAG: site-specific integrase [Smithellaceae bacterium]|nr:site-specific integrase [Smithellaceae bacterium]